MAGRSKEMGKEVEYLSAQELLQEQHRCEQMIRIYPNSVMTKGLRKRLHEIEKRIQREEEDDRNV